MKHTDFVSPHPFSTKISRYVHLKDLAIWWMKSHLNMKKKNMRNYWWKLGKRLYKIFEEKYYTFHRRGICYIIYNWLNLESTVSCIDKDKVNRNSVSFCNNVEHCNMSESHLFLVSIARKFSNAYIDQFKTNKGSGNQTPSPRDRTQMLQIYSSRCQLCWW